MYAYVCFAHDFMHACSMLQFTHYEAFCAMYHKFFQVHITLYLHNIRFRIMEFNNYFPRMNGALNADLLTGTFRGQRYGVHYITMLTLIA